MTDLLYPRFPGQRLPLVKIGSIIDVRMLVGIAIGTLHSDSLVYGSILRPNGRCTANLVMGGHTSTLTRFGSSAGRRVVKKLGRAVGTSLLWSESTPTKQVVSRSSDLLRPIEGRANS